MSNVTETVTRTVDDAPLYAALARAIARARAVEKDSNNAFHKYKYASAEALLEEGRGALADEGLCVIPLAWFTVPRDVGEGNHGGPAGYYADLKVKYRVAHSSGASIECEAETPVLSEKGRPEDKAVATALTYSIGYFIRGLLLLPRVDENHDVDRRDDREYQPRNGQGPRGQDGGALPPKSATAAEQKAKPPTTTADTWPAFLAEITKNVSADLTAHVGKPVADWTEADVEKASARIIYSATDVAALEKHGGAWGATLNKHARPGSKVDLLLTGFRAAYKKQLGELQKKQAAA